jgi:SAM-dependent methyltransferase
MLDRILRLFARKKQGDESAPALSIKQMFSFEDYMHYAHEHRQDNTDKFSFEKSLIPDSKKKSTYRGYCHVCGAYVDFLVDFKYAYEIDGILTPNWRERLVCPGCRLNNRMRAVVHVFDTECHPSRRSDIYITEQTTALYRLFKRSFPETCGSEYLGETVNFGNCNNDGIRNEDITRLSFGDNQFDFILSFDVFEHIPNYKRALEECYRCLKPGGVLFFSVPFERGSEKNVVRARISEAGEIVHLLPPEYHGDPVNPGGCLCFYHFGWEILDDLKAVGFKDSKALLYWSRDFGYLGGEQLILKATKMHGQPRL